MKPTPIIKNENGSVLIIALIMLVLLTLLGIAATSTSNVELQISGNERNFKRAFFAANSGIEHVKSDLNDDLVNFNQNNITMGNTLEWDFVLAGAKDITYSGGVFRLSNISFNPLNSYAYSVKIWNNDNDPSGSPTDDQDGIIFAQSEATGPNNTTVKVRVQLRATVNGEAINSYTAQQGGESGKGYSSQDLNAPSVFTQQI